MLTELKRCNSIGNIKGVLFLISIITNSKRITVEEIYNRCFLENDITVNCSGAIAFLKYLNLIEVNFNIVTPTNDLNKLTDNTEDDIIKSLAALSFNHLIEEGIFDKDATKFDAKKETVVVKKSAFPLTHAAIRNFLISVNAATVDKAGDLYINSYYEQPLISTLGKRKRKFTLDQLLKQKEEQNRRGLEAEEFVLNLERTRVSSFQDKVKRISDYDVSAGYDIVSFESNSSNAYDRFIEVKCYIGSPHFYWSENECDTAKIKGEKYILCLVDYNKINTPGYIPEYIRNPYNVLFSDSHWLINTASYHVQKI